MENHPAQRPGFLFSLKTPVLFLIRQNFYATFLSSTGPITMQRNWLGFSDRSFALVEALRGGSVILAILMTIAFFAGCESAKPTSQTDPNDVLREPDKGRAIHGEVGAAYGRSG